MSSGTGGTPEEASNGRHHRFHVVEQREVATPPHDVELGVRDAGREHVRVGERHQRVVVAGDDEGGRNDPLEPRRARPGGHREELVQVADR